MKKMILSMLVILMGFGVVGCANRGNAALSDKSKMSQIRTHKSTKKDVRRILGEPQSVSSHGDGKESWSYMHSNHGFSGKGAAKIALSFTPLALLSGVVGTADTMANGGDIKGKMYNVTFTFNKKGVLINKRASTSNISS